MKKVKGFHFNTVDDKDLLDHVKKQPNQSNYIKELIRKDMQSTSIEEIIRKQIEKYLEGMQLKTHEEAVPIDTAEVLNIMNL